MCGIFACVDHQGADVSGVALTGLRRLRYRGYDSWGFAGFRHGSPLAVTRSLDPLDETADLPAATAVIGHTRWATHGGVNLANCHPFVSADGGFALIHNGVVENYLALRGGGDAESDTAVIARLLEAELTSETKDDVVPRREQAIRNVMTKLKGANSVVALFNDGHIVGMRQGTPLVIAKNEGRYFIASDVLSFADLAGEVFRLEPGDMVSFSSVESVLVTGGKRVSIAWQPHNVEPEQHDLEGYPHYMLKEILEQWRELDHAHDSEDFDELVRLVRSARQVVVTGAGSAFITSRQIAALLGKVAGVAAMAVPAYEIDSIRHLMSESDLVLAISQSGETADTLLAVEQARGWGCHIASLTNMPLSTLASVSDVNLDARAGAEICVLSTKSATNQIAFGFKLAYGCLGKTGEASSKLAALCRDLANYLNDEMVRKIRRLAMDFASAEHMYILGQGLHHTTAMMAALNIKEASYIHAEAFAAGELKHGVLALVEEGTPVMVYPAEDQGRMDNAIAEVKARGATIIGVASEPHPLFDVTLPLPAVRDHDLQAVCGLLPGQLFAYALAVARGVNPDQPRNLAKSVTVL